MSSYKSVDKLWTFNQFWYRFASFLVNDNVDEHRICVDRIGRPLSHGHYHYPSPMIPPSLISRNYFQTPLGLGLSSKGSIAFVVFSAESSRCVVEGLDE
jgi:hypothetical protein